MTIDGSAANEAAITSYNEEHGSAIEIRKIKYLNNIVEIVLTQLTKSRQLTARMGGDSVADFDVPIGDENPINQAPLLDKCCLG